MAEDEKVTTIVLHVDLQCSKCYKKVKRLLCKFPEIRDQAFDEKANKVTIKVVCCSPEKIRDKLCCKGGGCIKSIEIIKPKEPEKPKEEPEKQKEEPEKPKEEPEKPKEEPEKPKDPVKVSVDVQVQGFFYCKCCSGRPWGPCSCGEQVQCVACYGRPVFDSWGGGCYTSGYAYYCTEQYEQGCTIM